MRKTVDVLKHELLTALRRPSFLFFVFGIPLIAILVFSGIRVYQFYNSPSLTSKVGEEQLEEEEWKVEGFVDQSGLIKGIPPDLPADILISFPTESAALEAINKSVIHAYYLIPEDYIDKGEFIYAQPDFSFISSNSQDWIMRWTILYNLTGGDIALASRIWAPANTQETDLSLQVASEGNEPNIELAPGCTTAGYDCESNIFLRYLPLIFLVLFFMSIMMASSLLIYSISLEKDNRVMEVLLLSISPQQMLNGKMVGLGILGLLQLCVYTVTLVIIINIGGQTLALPQSFRIPPPFFFWGLLFFILGYSLYAALMAGAGALVPDMKSYSGASMVVASPLFLGYMAAIMLSFDPNGMVITILSLVPFTSPVVMIWRMVNGPVPFWQPVTASILLAITVLIVVRAVARMFQAKELLSGTPFQLRNFLRLLFGLPTIRPV